MFLSIDLFILLLLVIVPPNIEFLKITLYNQIKLKPNRSNVITHNI